MTPMEKLIVLQETYPDHNKFGLVVDKLVDAALSEHRQRLQRYEAELRAFEEQFKLDSVTFYEPFEHGELGDNIDLFEWSALYELRQELTKK